MKTTALVTGAAGFMGSHIVDRLVDMGVEVVGMDDLSGGFIENVNPASLFVQGSITNRRLGACPSNDVFTRFAVRLSHFEPTSMSS